MTHETVWQVFEGHFPGRLGVSNREYERVPESVDAAKEWFPPKAPARVLTSRIRQRPGIGVMAMKNESQPVHRQLNDADAMRGFIRVLKEAEERFGVIVKPNAHFGQNEKDRHPELRVFLHPDDIRPKTVWWLFWMKKDAPVEPDHAAEVLDWVATAMEAKPIP